MSDTDQSAEPETLAERAEAQEGSPIPAGRAVRVVLRDAAGVTVESVDFIAASTVDEVARAVTDYIVGSVAEGEGGTVEWYQINEGDPWFD